MIPSEYDWVDADVLDALGVGSVILTWRITPEHPVAAQKVRNGDIVGWATATLSCGEILSSDVIAPAAILVSATEQPTTLGNWFCN